MDSALLALSIQATRALALIEARFRWFRVPNPADATAPSSFRDDHGYRWESWEVDGEETWLLDLSDPLTAAGLILLVREAYEGDRAYCITSWQNHGNDGWSVYSNQGDCRWIASGAIEVEALVAALEAAAERWAP